MCAWQPNLQHQLQALAAAYAATGQPQNFDPSLAEALLDEAGKLAAGVWAPLWQQGDKTPPLFDATTNNVTMPQGYKAAYQAYCEAGWNALPFPEAFGGQDLPQPLAFAVQELWQGANLGFGLCPLLNQSAVLALLHHGSDTLKADYLPKLVSGEWTGTMNLTEPQAGSDLSAIAAKAVPQGNGSFAVTGQKIYITFGEHDLAQNIIHLVLARLPDAPEGSKGISLFLVPKFLPDNTRNNLACVGIEHKMGIHASPTCVMQFSGATGFLVGKPHEGLKAMFTMMNHARLSVGLQGVAVLEHATQLAQNYAAERVQGFGADKTKRVSINHHPDVQRMLAQLQGTTLVARVLCFTAAAYLDGNDVAQIRVEILTPLVKAWITDQAVWGASVAVQVHGGMGFMAETAAAQLYKDVRILPIYEGTNGIQAQDLVFRKVLRDEGAALLVWLAELQTACPCPDVGQALQACAEATQFVCAHKANTEFLGLIAHDYLQMLAATIAGALAVQHNVLQGAPLAHYIAQHILPIAAWQQRFERLRLT